MFYSIISDKLSSVSKLIELNLILLIASIVIYVNFGHLKNKNEKTYTQS